MTDSTAPRLHVQALSAACAEAARRWAERLGLPLAADDEAEFAVQVGEQGLQVLQLGADSPGPVRVDFVEGASAHRRKFGGGSGQMIAKAVGVDGREVMDVICQDHKLNLSRYYMRPGFAFGGSCLPKDVRALTYRASQLDVEHPMLGSLMRSNSNQVQKAFDLITSHDTRKVGLLGLSFKAGTDDLRESPLVELAEMLIGKGYELRIFDRNVEYARVHGANKEYIESKIPHVSSLLVSDLDEVVASSDVLVLGNGDELFVDLVNKTPSGKKLVDLVGFMPHTTTAQAEGICW